MFKIKRTDRVTTDEVLELGQPTSSDVIFMQPNSEGLGMCEGWVSAGSLARFGVHDVQKRTLASNMARGHAQHEALHAKCSLVLKLRNAEEL